MINRYVWIELGFCNHVMHTCILDTGLLEFAALHAHFFLLLQNLTPQTQFYLSSTH